MRVRKKFSSSCTSSGFLTSIDHRKRRFVAREAPKRNQQLAPAVPQTPPPWRMLRLSPPSPSSRPAGTQQSSSSRGRRTRTRAAWPPLPMPRPSCASSSSQPARNSTTKKFLHLYITPPWRCLSSCRRPSNATRTSAPPADGNATNIAANAWHAL